MPGGGAIKIILPIEHTSTPGKKYNASSSVTSNAFTPPDNSFVVVMTGSDNSSGNVTVTSSPSVTWTVGPSHLGNSASARIFYHYYATSPGSITVATGSGSASTYQDIRVLTNMSQTQPGTSTTLSVSSGTVYNKAMTPTRTGGIVYAIAVVGFTVGGVLTAITGFTSLNTQAGSAGYFASGSKTVITPVSTSYGWTDSSSDGGGVAFLEILASPPNTPPNNFVPMIRSSLI